MLTKTTILLAALLPLASYARFPRHPQLPANSPHRMGKLKCCIDAVVCRHVLFLIYNTATHNTGWGLDDELFVWAQQSEIPNVVLEEDIKKTKPVKRVTKKIESSVKKDDDIGTRHGTLRFFGLANPRDIEDLLGLE